MLELLGKLSEKSERFKIGKTIAKEFGARELLIFIKDPELDILLPASGFSQTLEHADKWQIFLKKCVKLKYHSDQLLFNTTVTGVAYKDECVFLLVGGNPDKQLVESVVPILPLLASIMQYEQFEIQTRAKLLLSEKTMIEMQGVEKKLNTARLELQVALGKTEQEIIERKRIEKEKDEFIGMATHELKTPVTSIKAYAEVLQWKFKKAGDLVSANNLGKMNTQLNKLTSLIGDLLDSTRIDSGKLYMHKELFDFDELVVEIIEETQRITDRHTLVLDGGTKRKIVGDRERIGQVLTNLITNAIKYSPKADKIFITSKSIDKNITVCVRDFGVGISRDKQAHVFERFYRVSGPKQDTFPGLGLGLYISSEIIKREGGRIWVESVAGEGSTFCFTLPINKGIK
ncbi:MAG TPA: HAMP domain-containing sensor histidine kinase [Candidatus Limnocylindrales bacterium]|nr:HAMP domain-containing sensor histidine kinase [Candidatus Limnocylindrales bacterium]